jgi:hypothetical protein
MIWGAPSPISEGSRIRELRRLTLKGSVVNLTSTLVRRRLPHGWHVLEPIRSNLSNMCWVPGRRVYPNVLPAERFQASTSLGAADPECNAPSAFARPTAGQADSALRQLSVSFHQSLLTFHHSLTTPLRFLCVIRRICGLLPCLREESQ